jgi:hypothetical protein
MIPNVGECITQLVELVEAEGRVVHDYVPEDPLAPCWIVQGGEDVIQADPEGTYGQDYLVTLEVVILTLLDNEHDNKSATLDLWAALSSLAAALESTGGDWWLESVGQPGTLQTLTWKHHGVLATVRTRT